MALAMSPGGLRDLAAPAGGRQAEMTPGPPPFSNSRLRSYASRVEGLIDPKLVLSSSVALTGAGLADPFPGPSSSSSAPDTPSGSGAAAPQPSPRSFLMAAPPPHGPLPHPHPAFLQPGSGPPGTYGSAIGSHHAHFAPAPSVLTAPAAAGRLSPAMAATAPPPPAPTAAWPATPPGVGAAAVAQPQLPANAGDLAAALSQIQHLKAEIAGVETVLGYLKGSETATTTMGRKAHKLPSQEQLRARADALAASRAGARIQGGGTGSGGGGGPDQSGLLTPLRAGGGAAGAAAPPRARSAGDAATTAAASGGSGSGGGAAAAQRVFDTLSSETKLGRTWRVPRGPQPVGRGEAVILESALDEALPPGAITAKYGMGSHVELSFWSGGDVRRDFEMLEMVQREVGRQVSVSCVERGRIIDKLADRHAEIFVAVAAAAKAAAEGQREAMEQLASVRATAAAQAAEIASLRSEVATRGAEVEDLRHQLAEATTAHEHYVWDNEQEVEQLQAQADILASEVEHLHVRLSEAVAEKDAALSRGLERLEGELAAVTDERDDLAQRIRFVERQLHKLRTQMNATVDTAVAEVQTDPVEWGPVEEEDVPDDNSDTPSLAEIRARYAAEGYDALTPEERVRLGLPPYPTNRNNKEPKSRKRRRALGHFEGLISSERPGRVRGLPWTINAISAIYYDKLQADAVADREGNPRPRLADFAVEWHLTRFGLRNLAELNLLDLIASVRQHYRASVRVRWFGQFTGLVEVGDVVDTTPHVSFYLTVLTQLAAPNSLVSLFPDTGAGEEGGTPPVALKAAALPEATKVIFKYLNDPDAAVTFLARAVDPLTDPATQLVPLDPLVALLMAEYQRRWERNAAHLRSLFRAADFDDDGYIGYDEFVGVVRQLLPDAGDRAVAKMYSEAVGRLPEGQSLVDADTFLAVARAFGWDRWRIDVAPVTATTGTAASRPVSHWSPGGAPNPSGSFTTAPPPGGPGGGIVSRAASALSRAGISSAAGSVGGGLGGPFSSGSVSGPVGQASRSTVASNLRRTESVVGLSDADRALLRVLDGALEGLDPPLEDQVGGLLERLRGAVAAAQQQAAAANAAAAALPGLELGPQAREINTAIAADNALLSKLEGQYNHFRTVYGERTDPAAAWLAFRMLLTSLAAATAGPRVRTSASRSRPGSAKGTVGWGLNRATATRLTIPSLPFRAGSGARALAGGSAGAVVGGSGGFRTSPPATAGPSPWTAPLPGPGMGLGPGLFSGVYGGGGHGSISGSVSGSFTGPAGGSGTGTGSGMGGVGSRGQSAGALSPGRPRSATPRSPDLPGRPTTLAQMFPGGVAAGGFGRFGPASSPSSFTGPGPSPMAAIATASAAPDRAAALVIPSASSPAALHRNPLPATTSGRTTATPPSALGTPGGKRGVVFSLGDPPGGGGGGGGGAGGGGPAATAATVSAPAAPAPLSLSVAPAAPVAVERGEPEASSSAAPAAPDSPVVPDLMPPAAQAAAASPVPLVLASQAPPQPEVALAAPSLQMTAEGAEEDAGVWAGAVAEAAEALGAGQGPEQGEAGAWPPEAEAEAEGEAEAGESP